MRTLNPVPRALVFDFDGTIADTRELIVATFQETCRRLGLPSPDSEHIAYTIGIPLETAFGSLVGGAASDIERMLSTYREVFRNRPFDGLAAFPGVPEAIFGFREQGFTLAVASSRSRESLDDMLAYLGLAGCFTLIASREDSPEPKPSPALLQGVASRLGLHGSDMLMIGDTTFDMEMGRAAGAATCAVTWGNHDRSELESAAPTAIVNSAAELQALLARRR